MRAFPTVTAVALLAAGTAHAALVVSKAPTSNVDCVGGVCTATAADAVLSVSQLKSLLKAADLTLVSGAAAQDIVVRKAFSWKGGHTLTLDAYRGVLVADQVASQGEGGVSVITNDGGTDGNLSFSRKGALGFASTGAALSINGHPYKLVDSVAALAGAVGSKANGFFALTRDVDASLDGTYKAAPVATALDGTFDGLGHTIDKLDVVWHSKTDNRDLGLFAVIGPKGTLRNLTLTAPHIDLKLKQSGHHAGAVAAVNHGKIRNVTVSGASISATAASGGIAGLSDGDIEASLVQGGLVGVGDGRHAGGVVGDNAGTIGGSGSSAQVATSYLGTVGGLAGTNSGTIALSWATGAVSNFGGAHAAHYNPPSGGLVAINDGAIDRSWTTSAVDGGFGNQGEGSSAYVLVGGFVAINHGAVSNSYAGGSAKGQVIGYTAGFAEENQEAGTINTSYTHTSVDCHGCGVAGFLKFECPAGASNYWDTTVEQTQAVCAGLTGLTTTQFKSGLPAGFDPLVWGHDAAINGGYPYLLDNPPE